MMGFLEYIFKVNLVLSIAVLLHMLVFRKFTFFQWNRVFLLSSVLLSYLLPLIHWPGGAPLAMAADFSGINWDFTAEVISLPVPVKTAGGGVSGRQVISAIYLLGALSTLLFLMIRLAGHRKRCIGARHVGGTKVRVYVCPENSTSFTLFRRIYLGKEVWSEGRVQVLRHEKVHASQLHSLDLLFMNFAGVLLWFNPFVYLLLRSTRENHEFLADAPARESIDGLIDYLRILGEESFRNFAPGPVNYFKSSTIKKRIIMLTNANTHRKKKGIYLLLIPVFSLILLAFQSPVEPSGAVPGKLLTQNADEIPALFPLPEDFRMKMTQGYGDAIHPITKKKVFHRGVDFAAPEGTRVYAAAAGKVTEAGKHEGWGNYVILQHSASFVTRYTHLSELKVKQGQTVGRGDVIATVGNTGLSSGSHLHYEVWKDGENVNPAEYY